MDTGFFKWVWRFNALVIALTVTLLLSILVWESTSSLRRSLFNQRTTNTLAVPAPATTDPAAAPTLEPIPQEVRRYFGPPISRSGNAPYALPLHIEQEYENRGYSKSSTNNTINYKIVDIDAQTNRWLFAPANRLIIQSDQIVWRAQGQADQAVGTLLTVVEQDTNSDTRLSTQDTKTLYLVDPLWRTPLKVTSNVTSVLRIEAVGPDRFNLIYTAQGTARAAQILASDGAIVSEQIIPPQD